MSYQLLKGDCIEVLRGLEDESVQCVVTSPPYYGLRDYGVVGQIGLEQSPEEYVSKMIDVFREVRRVLRNDGVLWLNLGDSYAGVVEVIIRMVNKGLITGHYLTPTIADTFLVV